MKLFSRMLSKNNEPKDSVGNLDLDMDVAPLSRREEPRADDSGRINASKRTHDADDPLYAKPGSRSYSRDLAPDPAPDPAPAAMDSAWSDDDWDDDDWDDDDDWGDEDDVAAAPSMPKDDKEHLVGEIREAMGAANQFQSESSVTRRETSRSNSELRNWAEDEEFGRRAIARSQLNSFGADSEDRILAETNSQMTNRETSRRRSAMAHLKAAAAATKADAVLKHVVGRDPSGDPEEQSPYRDDLAKVVRPRSTSRPISRPVSRPTSKSASWDDDAMNSEDPIFDDAEEDVDAFDMEAELAAAEEERLARAPIDLSEEDFSDEAPLQRGFQDSRIEKPENAFSEEEPEEPAFDEPNAFSDVSIDEDEDEDDQPAFGAITPKRTVSEPMPEPSIAITAPVAGRAGRSAGRVKTRLLGFQAGDDGGQDIFAATAARAAALRQQDNDDLNAEAAPARMNHTMFPTGWIVVIDGPGRGACFTTFSGVSQIGRGEDQAIRLDFGDTSISRNNHAAIAYDDEQGKFFLGHGGKSNLVRMNGRPVLSTEELSSDDEIRIGETTLKFIALCDDKFVWTKSEEEDAE